MDTLGDLRIPEARGRSASRVRALAAAAVVASAWVTQGSVAHAAGVASSASTSTGATTAAPGAAAPASTALTVYPTCSAGAATNSDAAHGAYIAGKGSFDVGDYGTALAYFKDAYTRDCTKNELLVIIARAFELLPDKSVHNKEEALHALETYVERMPSADDTQRQKQRIDHLKEDIATQEAQEKAAADGKAAAAQNGAIREHTAAPWVVVGGGVALGVTGLVVFLVGSGKVSDANAACPNHTCANTNTSVESEGNTGNTLESVGGVMMGVGGAAIVGGVLWHFLEPTGPEDAPAASAKATVRFDPVVRPGYTGFGAVGTF